MNLLPAAHNVDDEVRKIPIPVLVYGHRNRSTVLGKDSIPLDSVCFVISKKTKAFCKSYLHFFFRRWYIA
jgi:hypothetical protein